MAKEEKRLRYEFLKEKIGGVFMEKMNAFIAEPDCVSAENPGEKKRESRYFSRGRTIAEKYKYGTVENQEFLKEIRETLFAFGRKFPSPAGGSYYLGDDGTPMMERPRETWITSRMVHVYSLAKLLGYPGSEELIEKGLQGLTGELHDDLHDGWYAGVTSDGGILPDKQCYAHAFVILAASSAYLAAEEKARELLDHALEVYDRFFWNENEGLSCDTWNTEFTVLDDYRGLNANMHTVEAFLAAADALGDDRYRERAGRIIGHVMKWAQENHLRTPEHFRSDWSADLDCNREKPDDPFKPYGATPGHGIEWARLIVQWCVSVYGEDSEADNYISFAEQLYGRAVADGWAADGEPGFCYTTDRNGEPVVHDRMHWTLAEAINTSAVLFQVTGKEKYADDYARYMKYLDECVLDHVNGSWFHQLDRYNHLLTTVWPGKSDLYHAVQATLIPYNRRIGLSIAAAVKNAEITEGRGRSYGTNTSELYVEGAVSYCSD